MARVPEGFEQDLSGYGPVIFDAASGEPIAWGFRILHHLGTERFARLDKQATLECVGGVWVVVAKRLTPEEAEAKYGPVTDLALGPRGGFKSVTYGTTMFFCRELRPATGKPGSEARK